MWHVYMLRCRDGSIYTGVTTNLTRRLRAHNTGLGARYTRARLPATLVYSEPCLARGEALRRERQLKRLSRVVKLRLLGETPVEAS
ncbi:GIY-YIG nuclease family protein [soil metagenome]